MVPIGNDPILVAHYEDLRLLTGHKGVHACASGSKGEIIKDYFRNYQLWNTSERDSAAGPSPKIINIINQHDEADWSVPLVDTGLAKR
jgi:NDP-sugar pyrophosphorylase family protein